MRMLTFIAGILYILYFILEHINNVKVRAEIKHVVHVNGIRGKSTVSRLIDAGLRESGLRVFTKTTGTSPRMIFVNGEEHEIKRKGNANIREQIKVMRVAQKQKAEIFVVECMAINPQLQWVTQNRILNADIGVITNVRLDHLDQMGKSLDSVASSLSMSAPKNGTLFTADARYFDYYKELGDNQNTKVYLSNHKLDYYEEIDFGDNVAIAVDVCKHLGVDEEIAIQGMKKYRKDPGALKKYSYINQQNAKVEFVNAMAANDPISTGIILQRFQEGHDPQKTKILLINNRKDRISRMEQYVKFAVAYQDFFELIWVTKDMGNLMVTSMKRSGIPSTKIIGLNDINELDKIKNDAFIFAVGNIGGYGKEILDYVQKAGVRID